MGHLSPASKEVLTVIHSQDSPTVDTIEEETTRPRSLIKELVDHKLSREHISIEDDGILVLTEEGEMIAERSQFSA
jgi:hypothetical protein